jgi:hypothetical protein
VGLQKNIATALYGLDRAARQNEQEAWTSSAAAYPLSSWQFCIKDTGEYANRVVLLFADTSFTFQIALVLRSNAV